MKKTYQCSDCGKKVVQDDKKKAPDCCGEQMKEVPLESCRESGNEASNTGDAPCQDFTGKQR